MIETIRYRLLMRRLRKEIAQKEIAQAVSPRASVTRAQMPVKSTCKAFGSIV